MGSYLKHVICFLPCPIAEAEAIEYLQTTTLKPVCLATENLGVSFVYDTGFHSAVSHPACCHEPVRQSISIMRLNA